MKIEVSTKDVTFYATLNDTVSAREMAQQLPVESTVSTWGDEIYFDLGFKVSADGATMDVAVGDVAYWSQGKCLCVFFGPTPASTDGKPLPASPVVIVGKTDAIDQLRSIQLGDQIRVALVKE